WLRRNDLSLYWCNTAYARALDRSREGVLSEASELAGSVIEEKGRALARRARDLDQPQQESHHLIAAGRRVLFDFCEMPLGDGRLAGYATDATAVEAMQAELGRHVAAQDELLERLGAAVAIYGPEARLRFFNKAFARMFGYDEARLRAEPTMDELLD